MQENNRLIPSGSTPLPRIICLAGPTGAGKTALALEMAAELGGEVVNADSRQIYRDFPIITAQPSPQEQSRCPHHLYGYLATEERTDTADWAERALEHIRDITARGLIPLLVGGTGFYFQTLLRGIADIPQVPASVHEAILNEMEQKGSEALYEKLRVHDPDYAAAIHPRDRQRTARALEVLEATGKPFSWWHRNTVCTPLCQGPLLVASTALSDLEERLRTRIDQMLAQGALEEGRAALARCSNPQAPGWSGIGCRDVFSYLEGRCTLQDMKENWFRKTRQYAKRQITWFRGREETIWIEPDDVRHAIDIARSHLD